MIRLILWSLRHYWHGGWIADVDQGQILCIRCKKMFQAK